MVPLQHDVCVYVVRLEPGAEVIHRFSPDRGAYVYVLDGAASLDRDDLSTGDAAEAANQAELTIRAWQTTELILVDFPMTAEPSTALA